MVLDAASARRRTNDLPLRAGTPGLPSHPLYARYPPRPCEKAMFKSLCGSSRAYAGAARKRVGFADGLDFHTERGSGGPHRLDERLHPEDGDHPLQIVGENVKAHLRADLFEGAQPEVGLRGVTGTGLRGRHIKSPIGLPFVRPPASGLAWPVGPGDAIALRCARERPCRRAASPSPRRSRTGLAPPHRPGRAGKGSAKCGARCKSGATETNASSLPERCDGTLEARQSAGLRTRPARTGFSAR